MSRLWKCAALFACAALCLSACGCAFAPQTESSSPDTTATAATTTAKPVTTTTVSPTKTAATAVPALGWDKSDSLSPYAAKTRVNRALAPLLYEGLTRVNGDYSASLCLAEKIVKKDKTHLTVTLKKGLKFSEKSALKAADVVNSFRLAAGSETYADLVADVASVKATDDRTLTVTLARAVPFYEVALSFPVVKTVKSRTVGTGAYRLNTKKTALEQNPYSETAAQIETFELQNVSRREEMQFALETGTICAYFDDLATGTVPRAVTDVTLTPVTVPYLVYLGFNANRAPWSSASIRRSVCDAVSRTDVTAVGFSGYAVPTATPFCPAYAAVKDVAGARLSQNVAAAVATWKKNGYNVTENGKVKNRLSAELICVKSNAMHKAAANEIAEELKTAGMQVSVKALSESDYKSRLASGNYDWYLGEVRLPNTLSLDAVLTGAGGASYGVSAGGKTLWAQYKNGELTAAKFTEAFQKEAPFLPLCYGQGVLLSSKRLTEVGKGVGGFDGAEQWIFT